MYLPENLWTKNLWTKNLWTKNLWTKNLCLDREPRLCGLL